MCYLPSKTEACRRNVVRIRPEPDQGPKRGAIDLAHHLDLGRALIRIGLVDADLVDPEVSMLQFPFRMLLSIGRKGSEAVYRFGKAWSDFQELPVAEKRIVLLLLPPTVAECEVGRGSVERGVYQCSMEVFGVVRLVAQAEKTDGVRLVERLVLVGLMASVSGSDLHAVRLVVEVAKADGVRLVERLVLVGRMA
ncbi:hypothetical protein SLS55_007650 [Diplodia seriata]|uniref:Uncharacterized protein n=1 Tax=Diplodia seriata TaxID=420778 RepID=A0ABR3C895_9PEZI